MNKTKTNRTSGYVAASSSGEQPLRDRLTDAYSTGSSIPIVRVSCIGCGLIPITQFDRFSNIQAYRLENGGTGTRVDSKALSGF